MTVSVTMHIIIYINVAKDEMVVETVNEFTN
jgi:hypothetical protein